jgi:putative OPT family oligopeptide transporter
MHGASTPDNEEGFPIVSTKAAPPPPSPAGVATHRPYIAPQESPPELTWVPVLVGSLLGIVFGTSSLYLVLKMGMTVSASIPVAVLSITLFRVFGMLFGRRATILENNIVQTTGSAGESIAFGVGVTIPALLLLGFDLEVTRVMTVGLLGGLLGILMMIPLRRAFIVRQHGKLPYPEGTACAEVLISGEKGGATAVTVFIGFAFAFFHKFATKALHLWQETVNQPLTTSSGQGLRGGVLGGELSPELLGVGFIIGPRIASIMVAGGVLAYLVIVPLIVMFGSALESPLAPATSQLIRDMSISEIRNNYVLYIGAGAVVTGGIISMLQALPLIFSSLTAGLRDMSANKQEDPADLARRVPRTERDLPMIFVLLGSVLLVVALAAVPNLGLGLTTEGITGALLILVFGFLFVSVSSRLTGEIGSSSNPISGMTVATLLLTCLIFLALGRIDKGATLTALTVAAVVCIAASNGGTTSQDLKTGYLVGATPKSQQIAILIGSLTSALVIGVTLLALNNAGTVYTNRPEFLPNFTVPDVSELTQMERVGGHHAETDTTLYHVLQAREGEFPGVPQGKYLVDDTGAIRYLVDPAINGRVHERDDGTPVTTKFEAPKTRLMALIIDGILNQKLPWELVLIGALSAVTLELAGVPSLPFAVGIYLPIQISFPIFLGGIVRWTVDKLNGAAPAEAESSPGVLLASGYIAGGAIAGVLVAFFEFAPSLLTWLDQSPRLLETWNESNYPAMGAFAVLMLLLFFVGWDRLYRRTPKPVVASVSSSKKP